MAFIPRIAAAAAALCCFLACNRIEMPDPYRPASEDEAPQKYVPYEAEYINVPEGTQSLIYLANTLVATCYNSGIVVLPKPAAATKAISDYQIVNVPAEAKAGVASENTLEMVVAFEDTKTGDHDYNDLVFQARMKITNSIAGPSSVDIDLTPVAMGASIRLGLGLVLTDVEGNVIADKLISDSCRTDLFYGDNGFINTIQTRKKYGAKKITVTTSGNAAVAGISWYLLSGGLRLYASNKFQACLDDYDLPQGLVLMDIREDFYFHKEGDTKYYCGNDFWQYPVESVPISEVYPGYDQAFITGGDFSIFANPTGRFFDAIAADSEGCLSANCLYDFYKEDCNHIVVDGGDEPLAGSLYYDNSGKAYKEPVGFDAIYDTYNPEKNNFILEFSSAKGNAIDFSRGDVIEAKITNLGDFAYNIGVLTPTGKGETLEGYSNGANNWFRVQDAFNHDAQEKGKSFPLPLIVRISQAKGIEYFIDGNFEQRLPSSNEALASILKLGTDKPLHFGLFGLWCSTATYEYLLITRNCDIKIESVFITPSSKTISVGETTSLAATVNPVSAIQDVTWSSSNPAVAKVDATSGEITGVSQGSCTITATSIEDKTKSGTCTLTVNNVPVSSISLEHTTVLVGNRTTLAATILPVNATIKDLTWSSSNAAIATVNAATGEVEGVSEGKCTITATSVSEPGVSGSCTLTVSTVKDEVMIWQNFKTNTSTVDTKELAIIASGTPADNQICFNNGDYIEVKLQRLEVTGTDHDLIYLGSQASNTTPYICFIGHNTGYTEIYVIPNYWWSTASVPSTGANVPLYARFGCKADGTRGCGCYSTDGQIWTDLKNSNDFEAEWQKMIDPSRTPFIIQTARNKGSLQLVQYDYVKIVRSGATAN